MSQDNIDDSVAGIVKPKSVHDQVHVSVLLGSTFMLLPAPCLSDLVEHCAAEQH